jgi:hypothetical protein
VDRSPQCPSPSTASNRAMRELDKMGI